MAFYGGRNIVIRGSVRVLLFDKIKWCHFSPLTIFKNFCNILQRTDWRNFPKIFQKGFSPFCFLFSVTFLHQTNSSFLQFGWIILEFIMGKLNKSSRAVSDLSVLAFEKEKGLNRIHVQLAKDNNSVHMTINSLIAVISNLNFNWLYYTLHGIDFLFLRGRLDW